MRVLVRWYVLPASVLFGCAARQIDPGHAGAGGVGAASVAGTGGTAGVAGAGGSPSQGSGGSYTPPKCPPKPQTHCTGTGTPPSNGFNPGTCDQEGNICDGADLGGDGSGCYLLSWTFQCCAGHWYRPITGDAGVPAACPTAGTPFSCGTDPGGVSCVVGQTACVESYDHATSNTTYACSNLCPAGDCSCFCTPDAQGSCSYTISDPREPSSCQCGVVRGEVIAFCEHGQDPVYGCTRDPSTDATCPANFPLAFACLSPDGGPQSTPQQSACEQLDDSDPNRWCCTN